MDAFEIASEWFCGKTRYSESYFEHFGSRWRKSTEINRLRRRQYANKGPNFLWHIDGYDKLKPYGIAISGCIDGYSRYIIWLQASYTNNDPKVIANYYLNAVEEYGGCPQTVRTDMGTENGRIEHMQTFLRDNLRNENVLPAFIYGTSQHNQRIEAWWSILRKHNAQFWMNLFETLKDNNLFNGNIIDKSLVQFCFLSIIQVKFHFFAALNTRLTFIFFVSERIR